MDYFTDTINKIRHLVELCTLQRVQVSDIIAFSDEYYDEYNGNRSPRSISILCSKEEVNEEIHRAFSKHKWITLTELMQYNSIEVFLKKYDLLKVLGITLLVVTLLSWVIPIGAYSNGAFKSLESTVPVGFIEKMKEIVFDSNIHNWKQYQSDSSQN